MYLFFIMKLTQIKILANLYFISEKKLSHQYRISQTLATSDLTINMNSKGIND